MPYYYAGLRAVRQLKYQIQSLQFKLTPGSLLRQILVCPEKRTFHFSGTRGNVIRKIDIRIQYPSEVKSKEKKESILPPGKGKDLVVVLLGWAGAQHKHLAKYSDFYLKRGAITVSHISPLLFDYISATHKYPDDAKEVLSKIRSRGLAEHPIFFHVFSNGGSSTYSYILREMENCTVCDKFEIKGTIFDSAPAPRSLKSLSDAGLQIYAHHKPAIKYAIVGFHTLVLIFQTFWFHMKAAVILCTKGESLDFLEYPETHPIPLSNWLEVIANFGNNNYLFLFSFTDQIIRGEEVERFSRICGSRGSRVKRVIFKDSEHVKHFQKYPEEYANVVIDFIRTTLTLPSASTQGK